MPSLSQFVSAAIPPSEAIQIAPNPSIGLDGGTLTDTVAELQGEIAHNADAASLAVVLFENALI